MSAGSALSATWSRKHRPAAEVGTMKKRKLVGETASGREARLLPDNLHNLMQMIIVVVGA